MNVDRLLPRTAPLTTFSTTGCRYVFLCRPLFLPPGHIDLWLCRHKDASDKALQDRCLSILAPDEVLRRAQFRFERDQHQFLLTRALVRTVLSHYAPIPAREWRFSPGPHGRPHIDHTLASAIDGLDFNLSHTNGLVVLAVGRHIEFGVDAEHLARAPATEAAKLAFSEAEMSALESLPRPLQDRRFFELWTLKESYVKARRSGMQIALDSFAFSLLPDDDHIGFTTSDQTGHHWSFWQMEATPDHLVSLCAATHRALPLVCREAMPFDTGREWKADWLRSSFGSVQCHQAHEHFHVPTV
ncbi:4'-phosphopantetheinyl transferase family protein [Diaphorobacter aerolatus]|uniref:4'-phosphopantetheinyl transferase superfamily protein n=1 Tax=Diaphorobacter aerolatus TaxID=1288495 RepID=A0A7H0GIQ5_9BURK|nr:4'-phosphopantetheinyl transferase superfamily protein [Diaphorobacter aerolatus]QNP48171.1 4'-phosphopantetheinyl transferase superfamily protein [Diaphorobacter aerolatus]